MSTPAEHLNATISRQPPGLLSFFGLKNTGRLPGTLNESYQLVIDALSWLSADSTQAESVFANANAVAAGTSFTPAALTVPNNELWIVTHFSVSTSAVLGAGVALQMLLSMSYVGTAGAQREHLGPLSNLGATGDSVIAARALPCVPFLAFPGCQLAAVPTKITAGPVGCDFMARFCRLRV